MKIAFISYEYPPDAAYGGIATYVHQAARMLYQRAHYVEVFTSSPYQSGTKTEDGVVVHRVVVDKHENFAPGIARIFAARHAEVQFDVLEGPEYGADAMEAVRLVPDIPLIVKLHTPTFLTAQGDYDGLPFLTPLRLSMLAGKTRTYVHRLCTGCKPSWRYVLNYDIQVERLHAFTADEIVAPSRAIGELLVDAWGLEQDRIAHVPYPYVPAAALLQIPVRTHSKIVTFLGRLEIRKGVLDLARAVPLVLRCYPEVKFRFVGAPDISPRPDLDMRQYLEQKLRPYRQSVEFSRPVPLHSIPDVLTDTDICVLPSIWDNFPNVCLESMAAARGIVGTPTGGMADMLNSDQVGRIVPPRKPKQIAQAVLELLENPELRMRLGQAARDRLADVYNPERIGALQEASYERAIERRRALGPRSSEPLTERLYD